METDKAKTLSLLLKEKCRRDPTYWLFNYVYTYDEHDPEQTIKPFPKKEYFTQIVAEWQKCNILHIAKSRQMTISWVAAAMLLHEAMFYPYLLQAVINKKEKDAQAFIERAKFIYDRQPKWLKELCPLDRKMRDMPLGNLTLENGSKLVSMPQGEDQIRGYVPSTVVLDEAAMQEKLEETYAACVPCSKRIVTISSANPGFFQRLCEL